MRVFLRGKWGERKERWFDCMIGGIKMICRVIFVKAKSYVQLS